MCRQRRRLSEANTTSSSIISLQFADSETVHCKTKTKLRFLQNVMTVNTTCTDNDSSVPVSLAAVRAGVGLAVCVHHVMLVEAGVLGEALATARDRAHVRPLT